MLEYLNAKSGHSICKFRGRQMGSRVDPVREAQMWVQSIESKIADCSQLIVLGMGCGYHLIELRRLYRGASILAIDGFREMVEFNQKLHSVLLADVDLVLAQNSEDLSESCRVQKALRGPYKVLEHGPSLQLDPLLYKDLKETLLGRNTRGAELLARVRPDFALCVEQTKLKEALDRSEDDLIHIKMIHESLEVLNSQNFKWWATTQLLRELVK